MSDDAKCPYVVGTTTLHCSLTPFTLTDAEREAIAYMLRHAAVAADGWAFADSADYRQHHDAVFALLERTK
jgi:hypothetical protein